MTSVSQMTGEGLTEETIFEQRISAKSKQDTEHRAHAKALRQENAWSV